MVFLPSSRLRTFARCGPLPFGDTYLNAIEEEMPNGAFFPCRPEHPWTGRSLALGSPYGGQEVPRRPSPARAGCRCPARCVWPAGCPFATTSCNCRRQIIGVEFRSRSGRGRGEIKAALIIVDLLKRHCRHVRIGGLALVPCDGGL